MSLPSPRARPPRFSGSAIGLLLVVLLLVLSGTWHAGQAAAGATPSSRSWAWPVGPDHVVSRPFVAPLTPYSAGHRGIDITASAGAVVVAPADGVVHFSGVIVDRPVLSIRHPDGLISSFEPVQSALGEGDEVRRGDAIGTVIVGQVGVGHCAEPCLHFGVRRHGEYVSPLNYLGGIPRSVLLPTRPLRRPHAARAFDGLARTAKRMRGLGPRS